MKKKIILLSTSLIVLFLFGLIFFFFVLPRFSPKTTTVVNNISSELGYQNGLADTKNQPENPDQVFTEETKPVENKSDLPSDKPVASTSDQPKTNPGQPVEKQTKNETSNIIPKLVNWGFESSQNRNIEAIIIHSSYDALGKSPYDLSGLLDEYKQYGVSAHYLIDREGKIYQLVKDKDIAYHAGKSQLPDGKTNVNEVSIGIEIMNTEKDNPTKKQYAALSKIISDLKNEYPVKYVLGHNQIAPDRKSDPWNFDWSKL